VPAVAAILVTGIPGTGTSTAPAEPARRGFELDTDYGGYSVEISPVPGSPLLADGIARRPRR
jgi:hypothetical protein